MTPDRPPRYAVFVSGHGFGHAARSSAVMAALHRSSGAEFEIFSTAPRWFFEESLRGVFRHHPVECDVGFRQASALRIDLEATIHALDALLPFDEAMLDGLGARVREAGCSVVVCDIAPMGVAVAEHAGLPSVVVESFTWPWLYAPYYDRAPGLRDLADMLDAWRSRATLVVQTDPLCERDPSLPLVAPISREPRRSRSEARVALGLEEGARVVAVTMGGHGEEMPFLDRLRSLDSVTFLVTGQHRTREAGNLRLISNRTAIFMPDLLRSADAVVAKLGYGIVAEVWREGLPYAFVSRPGFPEMPPLEAFARRELTSREIPHDRFATGAWIDDIPALVEMPRTPHEADGADAVARLIESL